MKKYKNLTLVAVFFLLAILLSPFLDLLLSYLLNTFDIYSAIILGFFYSFSFTGGASAVMLSNIENNFLLFSLLSAVGSMLADLTILKILKSSLESEIDEFVKKMNQYILIKKAERFLTKKVRLVLAVIVIGSPLPDEIGVFLLRKNSSLSRIKFLTLCFCANFTFIYIISRFL